MVARLQNLYRLAASKVRLLRFARKMDHHHHHHQRLVRSIGDAVVQVSCSTFVYISYSTFVYISYSLFVSIFYSTFVSIFHSNFVSCAKFMEANENFDATASAETPILSRLLLYFIFPSFSQWQYRNILHILFRFDRIKKVTIP